MYIDMYIYILDNLFAAAQASLKLKEHTMSNPRRCLQDIQDESNQKKPLVTLVEMHSDHLVMKP